MKRIKLILITLLTLAMLFAVSCGDETCTSHVDANADGKCDTCDAAVEKQPCTECKDENGDGKCDVCGNTVEKAPCEECVDSDGDGFCDVCDNEYVVVLKEVALIEKGKANFNVVVESGLPGTSVKYVDQLINTLKGFGVTVTKVEDKENTAQECEILIGNITSRGDKYKKDMHVYGAEGYTVELIDSKVLIVPGSNDAYEDAIEAFKTEFLGITDSTKKLTKVIVTSENNVTEIQDNYRVKQLTLFGKDMKGFTIAADKSVKEEYNTALEVQNTIYVKTGYWFDIVPHAEADKSIVIKLAEKTGGLGYKITVEENKVSFVCEYVTCIKKEITSFFTNKIAKAGGTGVAEFTESDATEKNVRDVFYKDFGVVGNGRVDDSEAIRACHEYANLGGHDVHAGYGDIYYIGVLKETIPIKTNVDWKDATFILDDSIIAPNSGYRGVAIFTVLNEGTLTVDGLKEWMQSVNASGGLDASTTKIPVNFGESAFIRIYNPNHKNYIRYGVNANAGSSQTDNILVDKDGNIDPTTPLMFDVNYLASFTPYKIELEPLLIQGGVFKTSPYLTNTAQEYTAYGRGLSCNRSNVTFKNIKHYLENEGSYNYYTNTGDYGCPYGGFYGTYVCNNVVFENCLASARIVYKGSNGAGMGSYDVSPEESINVVFRNCYQEDENFFDSNRWDVMGSSGCKNITYDSCKLTRFDAHAGVHNVYIVNSVIENIRINGTGIFYMAGTKQYSATVGISLREDYGGFWRGNIILKDITIISDREEFSLFTNTWYNHYFGYPAASPSNIIIDNLKMYKDEYETPFAGKVNLFNSGMLTGAANSVKEYLPLEGEKYADGTPVMVANKNMVPAPERIIIRNTTVNITIPDKTEYKWFENTVISVGEQTECTAHINCDGNNVCDDCGKEFSACTEHSDINKDGYCTWCSTEIDIPCTAHTDRDRNGECDTCKKDYTCQGHADTNEDHICDICAAPLCNDEHSDVKTSYTHNDCYCDVCYEKLPCKDEDSNKKCDVCGEAVN